MACCFASQNHLGRLCDERVYENDVAARIRAQGIADLHTQVPVTVSENVSAGPCCEGIIYELKTVAAFAADHEAQAIHYAALTATDRVKLINFRSSRVDGWLLRSPLWRVNRREFAVNRTRWKSLSEPCEVVLSHLTALLGDWGAFLEAGLYEEALVHVAGGESGCMGRLPVVRAGLTLGTHRMACLDAKVGLLVTAFSNEAAAHEAQLRRLLRCLPLRGLQWFNLNRAECKRLRLLKAREWRQGNRALRGRSLITRFHRVHSRSNPKSFSEVVTNVSSFGMVGNRHDKCPNSPSSLKAGLQTQFSNRVQNLTYSLRAAFSSM